MSRLQMLQKQQDFRRTYNEGKSFVNRALVLYIRNNTTSYNRLGISISKKNGNAVTRNKIRRRLKEIIRLHGYPFNGYDVIFIVRQPAVNQSYQALEKSVLDLFSKSVKNIPQ